MRRGFGASGKGAGDFDFGFMEGGGETFYFNRDSKSLMQSRIDASSSRRERKLRSEWVDCNPPTIEDILSFKYSIS